MQMLRKVAVENFRGLRRLELDGLKRLNIVAGRNDAGKTSLLESIFFLSGMTMGNMPERINDMRLMSVVKDDDVLSLFYSRETVNAIRVAGSFDGGILRQVQLETVQSSSKEFIKFESPVNDLPVNTELHPSFRQSYRVERNGTELVKGELKTLSDKDSKIAALSARKHFEHWPCAYLPTRKTYDAFELLKKLIVAKQKDHVLGALHAIDSAIADLTVVGDQIQVDTGLSKLLPLSVLGDGMVRTAIVLAAATACANGGLLLVDEIDTGLHFSGMQGLWKALSSYAKTVDLQVIATTHNIDFLKAAGAVQLEADDDDFCYYKLICRERTERINVAFPLSLEEFNAALDSEKEVR